MKKRDAEKGRFGKEQVAGILSIFRCELPISVSSGLLKFCTIVLAWDCHFHCANWIENMAEQHKRRLLKIYVFYCVTQNNLINL